MTAPVFKRIPRVNTDHRAAFRAWRCLGAARPLRQARLVAQAWLQWGVCLAAEK
jgi:hypothetical protein